MDMVWEGLGGIEFGDDDDEWLRYQSIKLYVCSNTANFKVAETSLTVRDRTMYHTSQPSSITLSLILQPSRR